MARPADQPRRRRRTTAIPAPTPAALTPEQVGILLTTAHQDRRPWLRAFVVLAAATGARTGELCGLEWHDLDLNVGTVSHLFRPVPRGGRRAEGRRREVPAAVRPEFRMACARAERLRPQSVVRRASALWRRLTAATGT